jgi:hypothetical protein
MSLINNDLNIFYSGASGGFYLLHYLLLFNQHWCVLEFPTALQHVLEQGSQAQKDQLRLSPGAYADCAGPDWPDFKEYNRLYPNICEPAKSELALLHTKWAGVDHVDQGFDTKLKLIFDHQWTIKTTSKWKQGEVWPDNPATLREPAPPRPYKIYFTCMGTESDIWPDLPGKKVLIYTDIKTQLRMAKSKNANWFNNNKHQSITQIKKFMRQSFTVNDQKIYHRLQPYFDGADHVICLQDLVANPEAVLGVPVTDRHRQFTQHWKNCHPLELLQKTRLAP